MHPMSGIGAAFALMQRERPMAAGAAKPPTPPPAEPEPEPEPVTEPEEADV